MPVDPIHEETHRHALRAYDDARRSLLTLAEHAIREAFAASPSGMQLALSLTGPSQRNRFLAALPLLAADARLPWLKTLLTEVRLGLQVFERSQQADAAKMHELAAQTVALRDKLAATIPDRAAGDEHDVILYERATGLCYVGRVERRRQTFIEYRTVGATAFGNVRVVTRGETAWSVLGEEPVKQP